MRIARGLNLNGDDKMEMINRSELIRAIKCNQRNRRGEYFDCKMEYCPYWREDKETGYSICDTYKIESDAVELLTMDTVLEDDLK